MVEHVDIHRYTDPAQDGEEAEGNCGSGSVGALGQWQLLRGGSLPLIGQKTEANKPQEAGYTWRRDKVQSKQMSGVMNLHEKGLFIIMWHLWEDFFLKGLEVWTNIYSFAPHVRKTAVGFIVFYLVTLFFLIIIFIVLSFYVQI